MGWDLLYLCMTGLFLMLHNDGCMYVCTVFLFFFYFLFFSRKRKGKKRKGENYCSRHPKSPVFNFRSRRVSFAEEDDLDRDVVSVCKGQPSQSVSQSVPCYR